MAKSLLFRLFGLGKIPKLLSDTLRIEGVVVSDEDMTRNTPNILFCALAAVCLVLGLSLYAVGQQTSLTGDWAGDSICVGNNPSCHDEKVVYHISIIPMTDPEQVKIAAAKIIDGKPEPMGVIDLKYDSVKKTLTGELQNSRFGGLWQFTVDGNIIQGVLIILPGRYVARKIRVQKNESV